MICAIFETAFVFFTQEAFDNAVSTVARQILINTYSSNSNPTSASLHANTSALRRSPPSSLAHNVVLNINTETSFGSHDDEQQLVEFADLYWIGRHGEPGHSPGQIVIFQAFYPMPVYLSVLTATGMGADGVGNLYSHTSNSVYAYPTGRFRPRHFLDRRLQERTDMSGIPSTPPSTGQVRLFRLCGGAAVAWDGARAASPPSNSP